MHWFLGQRELAEELFRALSSQRPASNIVARAAAVLSRLVSEARFQLGCLCYEVEGKDRGCRVQLSRVNYWLLESDLCHPLLDLLNTWFTRFFFFSHHLLCLTNSCQRCRCAVSHLHSSKTRIIDLMYLISRCHDWSQTLKHLHVTPERILNVSSFKALNA